MKKLDFKNPFVVASALMGGVLLTGTIAAVCKLFDLQVLAIVLFSVCAALFLSVIILGIICGTRRKHKSSASSGKGNNNE